MVTRRVRSEYMKRFREPRWDSFSRCYEDCVRYRVSRRIMEATHLPWGWEPYSSSSSGCSTPRGAGGAAGGAAGGVQDPQEEVVKRMTELRISSPEASEERPRGRSAEGPEPVANGFHGDMDSISSSDGEVLQPRRPRPRHCPLQAEAKPQRGTRTSSEQKTSVRKTRAKSQPPSRTRDRDQSQLDWTQRHMETHTTPNNTGRPAHMRRSRSADLKKQTLSVTYDPWVTEYMHCYSARV